MAAKNIFNQTAGRHAWPDMKKVLLLFCQGTEIMEAAAFYDVLGWSGSEGLEPVKVVRWD